ncbi:MAG: dCTP deaminase [Candidatus Shapirobacteria bacterium]
MILSDQDLLLAIEEKKLVIDPFDPQRVQPSSYDLHLDEKVLVFENHLLAVMDVREKAEATRLVEIDEKKGFILHPGEFILGNTQEKFVIPNDLAAKLEGRSSLGRIGLIIHATAGYVDPGFSGQLTFEISNISRLPIRIFPKMRIAQICFIQMTSPAKVPYGSPKLGSKYKGQMGPTESRIYKDFAKKRK